MATVRKTMNKLIVYWFVLSLLKKNTGGYE